MAKVISAPLLFETDIDYGPNIFDQIVVLNTRPVRVLRGIRQCLPAIAGQQPLREDKTELVEQRK